MANKEQDISQSECLYKVWVKDDYSGRIIRSTLNSDIEITDANKYGAYNDFVVEICEKVAKDKLFKLEYKGNIAGWFTWDGRQPTYWFLKPNFRTEHFLKCMNTVINGTYYLDVTMNEQNINIESTNIFNLIEYKKL